MTVQKVLEEKLRSHLNPQWMRVINESPSHRVPEGSESHFRVIVVSEKFQGLSQVKRHQMVYQIIDQELKNSIHAFSQQTFTPEEWIREGGEQIGSPPCRGGETSSNS